MWFILIYHFYYLNSISFKSDHLFFIYVLCSKFFYIYFTLILLLLLKHLILARFNKHPINIDYDLTSSALSTKMKWLIKLRVCSLLKFVFSIFFWFIVLFFVFFPFICVCCFFPFIFLHFAHCFFFCSVIFYFILCV